MPRAQMSAWNSLETVLRTHSEAVLCEFLAHSEPSPVRSKSACCLALGSGTRKTPRTGVWHQEKRLALGSGTDVKSQATFSSGPDPSVRQQAQLVAQKKFLTPLRTSEK